MTHECRGCGAEVEDGDGFLFGECDECARRHREAERRMRRLF